MWDATDVTCRRSWDLDTAGKIYAAALDDPYATDVDTINGALWERVGMLMWSRPDAAERCLRAALAHNPHAVATQLPLGWQCVARGRTRVAKRLLTAGDPTQRRDLCNLAEQLFLESGEARLAADDTGTAYSDRDGHAVRNIGAMNEEVGSWSLQLLVALVGAARWLS